MPRPETETIELRKDSIQSLIGLLENPVEFNSHKPPMTTERRLAVINRIKEQIDE
jgi:hypothetical protein